MGLCVWPAAFSGSAFGVSEAPAGPGELQFGGVECMGGEEVVDPLQGVCFCRDFLGVFLFSPFVFLCFPRISWFCQLLVLFLGSFSDISFLGRDGFGPFKNKGLRETFCCF